ncbi:MAG: hypothetical protein RL757_2460 [Bacteroidota bacterium]|jgi:hypothetical protein
MFKKYLFIFIVFLLPNLAIAQTDSAKIMAQIVENFCQNAGQKLRNEGIKSPKLFSIVMNNLLEKPQLERINTLAGFAPQDRVAFEILSFTFETVLYECLQQCPVIDTIFETDGKQRPAYAHFKEEICDCISARRGSKKYLTNYQKVRDSCAAVTFKNPKNVQIAFAANDFKTDDDTKDFDANFGGYLSKNCFEATRYFTTFYKILYPIRDEIQVFRELELAEMRKSARNKTITDLRSSYERTNTPPSYHFRSDEAYAQSRADLERGFYALSKLNQLGALDFLPSTETRSDNVTEHIWIIYNYQPKPNKRFLVGKLIFEFENKETTISRVKYFDKKQLPNRAAIEQELNQR